MPTLAIGFTGFALVAEEPIEDFHGRCVGCSRDILLKEGRGG